MEVKKLKQDEMISWLRLVRSTAVIEFFNLLKLHQTTESVLQHLSNKEIYSTYKAQQELEKAEKIGAKIVAACEPEFPSSLKGITPVITVLSDMSLLNREIIAMVGDYSISDNSKKFSKEVATDLIQANFAIVSNLDIIISPIILVAANGTALQNLKEVVDNGGLIVTGSSLITEPQSQHFFQKNNIISGLSIGVIVIEVSQDSESLMTVGYALDQNKEIFAVPGHPLDSHYTGNNSLIKNGARLIESADDVIDILRNTKLV